MCGMGRLVRVDRKYAVLRSVLFAEVVILLKHGR